MHKMIVITVDCRTQYGEFFAGETRKVAAEVAGFLTGNGWATAAPVTLQVDNVSVGQKASEAG